MPDSKEIRKKNPIDERPSLGAGGARGSGGSTPATQIGQE